MKAATVFCFIFHFLALVNGKVPHFIVILADDVGRNDVGYHGSNQIPTPNIDALGYNGIILNKFYTQSICTPSRTALLTGQYPIRSGMQGIPLSGGENRSIPLNMRLLPEYLKDLGYKTHLVGKWHLGAAYRKETPTGRGFDSHFGYWNGFMGYFNYLNGMYYDNETVYGMDLHDKFTPLWSIQNRYATDLFTEKTLELIDDHNPNEPLFLVLSHLGAHTGFDGVELGVPNITETNIKFSYIKNPRRRLYTQIVNLIDESVGQVVEKLAQKQLLANSVILFISDNGAPTTGYYANDGSNWPLRGMKSSEFEGGVRVAGAIFSPLFQNIGYVNEEVIHLVDILPTFYSAAGGNVDDLGTIDGLNQWKVLSEKAQNDRKDLLLNINEIEETSAIIGGDHLRYKFLKGTYQNGTLDKYFGDSGRDIDVPPYNYQEIIQSKTNKAIGRGLNPVEIDNLRKLTDLSWCRDFNNPTIINCIDGCLFDLEMDPCETTNLLGCQSDIAEVLQKKIEMFRTELVPQTNERLDPLSNPRFYNNTWCTWLDDKLCSKTPRF